MPVSEEIERRMSSMIRKSEEEVLSPLRKLKLNWSCREGLSWADLS
jgi:hypothetical protein